MFKTSLFAFTFLLLPALSANHAVATDWNGNWASNFGQLRLLQNGNRLYGDYAERGRIEGTISADGRSARAFFIYNDGRWGTVQWRKADEKISGTWNWKADGLPPGKGGKSWTATRSSARASPLKYSDQTRIQPPSDPVAASGKFRLWVAFAKTTPQPDPLPNPNNGGNARAGLSDWYGSYKLVNVDPTYEINVDVIHFQGSNVASADISFYVRPGTNCPETLHVEFCADLRATADSRGFLRAEQVGTKMINLGSGIGETLEVYFQLPGDTQDRLLRIRREATYFSAAIFHNDRGYDYEGFVRAGDPFCEQGQCQTALFTDLKKNPSAYRAQVSSSYSARLINSRNRIAASHGQAEVRPSPSPAPDPSPSPAPTFQQELPQQLSGRWAILDETSENVGEISIVPSSRGLRAEGKLRGFFENADGDETEFRRAVETDEAIAFDLTVFAAQSGEQKSGRLMVERPSLTVNNPRGTLIVEDDVFLVELVRPVAGLDPRDVGDTPAIGIYSVSYTLRDVPVGRTIRLRSRPDRSSDVIGALPYNARDLQILKCSGEINSQRFQQGRQSTREALLASHWCQMTDGQIAGWMPGRHLSPQ